YEWELTKSPAGANQWHPVNLKPENHAPQVDGSGKKVTIMMTTADLALRFDPAYEKISRRFYENPAEFEAAFARAWFKLTHRDMGPRACYLGSEVPTEDLIWQDPIPKPTGKPITKNDVATLKTKILGSGLTVSQLVATAWASASTFRGSDRRGGANGARIRFAPQNNWEANNPAQLNTVLSVLASIQNEFNSTATGRKSVSMADLIVLGGVAAIEKAAADAGHSITVPFTVGRGDATLAQTDVDSFAVLEPVADGFRNYKKAHGVGISEELLIDKAQLLTLTAPEMTVLVGGMRALNANFDGSKHGIFTNRAGQLTNDFFVNLLNINTVWKATDERGELFEGTDRATGQPKWTATRADLIFGSNSELRAIAEVYGSSDSEAKFVKDFVKAWTKVMNLDMF
ncbi:MAG: catalase-peroxidase, partial [Alphaproteobacteria bacterium]